MARKTQLNTVDGQLKAASGQVVGFEWPSHVPRPVDDDDAENAMLLFQHMVRLKTRHNVFQLDTMASLAVLLIHKGRLLKQLDQLGFLTKKNGEFGATVTRSPVWDVYQQVNGEAIRLSNKLGGFNRDDHRTDRTQADSGLAARVIHQANAQQIDWKKEAEKLNAERSADLMESAK